MVKKTLLLLSAVALAATGCNCGKQPHTGLKPDYLPDPMALEFTACQVKDMNGMAVPDVFPDVKTLTINNHGVVSGGLKLTITGTDAAAFSVDAMGATGIQASSSIMVKVSFAPVKAGDSKADLAIADEVDGTNDVHVTLVGTSPNLPAVATLEVRPFDTSLMSFPAQPPGPCFIGSQCTETWPDTLFGDSNTLQIKLLNNGCPALKIKGIELLQCQNESSEPFTLDSPTPPSMDAPILIAPSGGVPEQLLTVRFSPTNDGSGNPQRCGILRLHTNDPTVSDTETPPVAGNYDIYLTGDGVQPDLYTVPASCQYSDQTDLCGNMTRMPNTATFQIENGGGAPLTIDGVSFKSNGSATSSKDGRFTVMNNIVGQTIPPGGKVALVVNHNDMPLYVSDLLTVTAGTSQKAVISLGGGLKPCLSTTPAIDVMSGQAILDFMSPTTDMSARPLMVNNGAGCGDLIVNNVTIDANAFFAFDPMNVIAPGTTIAAGMSMETDVIYTKPVSGGTQVGTLRIDTNDSAFAGPAFYVVQLYSSSPLDQVPVAVLDGCLPSDPNCASPSENSMSVSLAALGTTKTLIMSGQNSYDPGNTSSTPISAWQFRLVGKPTNAAGGSLANDGVKGTMPAQVLTLDPSALGLYKVTLTVYDDHNQASGAAAQLNIDVKQ